MKKFLNLMMVMCFFVTAQAQFTHTFTNSTSMNLISYPYVGDPGCFVKYSGSPNIYWDNNAGGMKTPDNLLLIMLPFINLQSSYTLKVTYTSDASFNMYGNAIEANGSVFSGHTLNSLPAAATATQATLNINGSLSGLNRLYFYTHDNGFANVTILSVEVTNATYSPGSGCSVQNGAPSCVDTDSDGVCDTDDDYPTDPNKAYSSMVPATTFMYEDLFPSYGDFDFNDLVVAANREVITDADNTLRYLVVEAEVKAAGGSIAQGWALELNGISPSDVVSVTGSDVSGNVMTLGANGTENGQTHAVIPVFDNVNKVINRVASSFFNTVSGTPAGTGETITVTIEFAKSSNLTLADVDYNFFSFRTADRTHEIHEMGMAPTNLANQALFGTKADASDLNNGETYVSVDGFPWAMSTSGSDYAIEKVDMVEAFLKFAGWAQSGGTMHQDWHTNTAEGTYRNSAKIY